MRGKEGLPTICKRDHSCSVENVTKKRLSARKFSYNGNKWGNRTVEKFVIREGETAQRKNSRIPQRKEVQSSHHEPTNTIFFDGPLWCLLLATTETGKDRFGRRGGQVSQMDSRGWVGGLPIGGKAERACV